MPRNDPLTGVSLVVIAAPSVPVPAPAPPSDSSARRDAAPWVSPR